jgi:hypothetical protein
MDLLPFFNWLDTSFLADLSKAYGGVFAVVQMFHLLSMAVLGGMVLLADLRLLGVLMTDVPVSVVVRETRRGFDLALLVLVASGVFMSSAVAMKLYYNEMYWAKMTALLIGVLFVYLIRRPLLGEAPEQLQPVTRRLIALSSLTIWFTVAASGRWIGFS